jgi:peptidoglycan pentaglycine glycine transferase (the first glycine)
MPPGNNKVIWQIVPNGEAAHWWDEQLVGAGDYTVFQSFGWGEFKRREGWQPCRIVGRDPQGHVAAMVQLLVKTLPFGFAVGWAPGGPTMDFSGRVAISDVDLPGLFAALEASIPRILVRFDSNIPIESDLVRELGALCRRPRTRLNSGFSIRFDISRGAEFFTAQMSSKHRYYLRKAAAPLRWEAGASDRDIAALVRLHSEMIRSKELKLQSMSTEQYAALRGALGPQGMTILTGYLDDQPVTSCLTLDFHEKSFYLVAATAPPGRQIGAAYAMLPQLVAVLSKKGIKQFDFGGVAPESPESKGVYHFKKGFGGEAVEYLGEWEWTSVPLLSSAVNLFMKYRGIAA